MTPPLKATAMTPPTKPIGKLIIIMAVEGIDLTERYISTVIAIKAIILNTRMFRLARSSASN